MEIFTFVYMGGHVDRITFVPLTKLSKATTSGDLMQTSAEERQRERTHLLGGFRTFDASKAKCANLGIIRRQ